MVTSNVRLGQQSEESLKFIVLNQFKKSANTETMIAKTMEIRLISLLSPIVSSWILNNSYQS